MTITFNLWNTLAQSNKIIIFYALQEVTLDCSIWSEEDTRKETSALHVIAGKEEKNAIERSNAMSRK